MTLEQAKVLRSIDPAELDAWIARRDAVRIVADAQRQCYEEPRGNWEAQARIDMVYVRLVDDATRIGLFCIS